MLLADKIAAQLPEWRERVRKLVKEALEEDNKNQKDYEAFSKKMGDFLEDSLKKAQELKKEGQDLHTNFGDVYRRPNQSEYNELTLVKIGFLDALCKLLTKLSDDNRKDY